MTKKLAVALDLANPKDFWFHVEMFSELDVVLKIGQKALPFLKFPEDMKRIKESNDVFLDLKLHDIPSQVADAAQRWADLGVDYLTIHLSGGEDMLSTTAKAVKESNIKLLGISVLTSLDASDLPAMGVQRSLSDQVSALCEIGFKCGLKGVVCSVGESALVKTIAKRYCQDAVICTPGIKLGASGNQDQQRSYGLNEVMASCSNLLVVGRSIIQAEDPRGVAQSVLSQLSV